MNQDQFFASLRAEARRVQEAVSNTVWYVFGSAIREFECARDVDIVVLCDSHEAVALVRPALRSACMRLPLHLFLITRDEENELRFIGSQGCIQLLPSYECEQMDSGVTSRRG